MMLTPLVSTLLPRLVEGQLPLTCCRGFSPPDAPTLYLTFDDGPHPGSTPHLVDLLDWHGAPATHFLLGQAAAEHPRLARMLVRRGDALGNHSWTHPDPWRTPTAALRREYEATDTHLADLTGTSPTLLRPPYGRITRGAFRHIRAAGQRLALWDVMPGDFLPRMTPDKMARFLARWVRPGSVVVLHDTPAASAIVLPVLERLLPQWQNEGYRFASLA